METTATITPGVFLIILAITIAISLGAGYAARMFEERPKPAEQTQPTSTPVEAAVEQPVVPNEHTALKVTLDKSLAWHLEVDGVRLAPTELTAEQRARLVNIIVQIRPWIDGKTAPAPVASPAAAPLPPPQPVAQPAPPVTVAASTKKPPSATGAEKPKVDMMRGFRSLVTNDLKTIEKSRPVSIVAMIDDFLQKRLAASALANREIRLEEGALGEVVVFIGKESFAGVEAVPDPEIQAIIRAAIKDWEKSS